MERAVVAEAEVSTKRKSSVTRVPARQREYQDQSSRQDLWTRLGRKAQWEHPNCAKVRVVCQAPQKSPVPAAENR